MESTIFIEELYNLIMQKLNLLDQLSFNQTTKRLYKSTDMVLPGKNLIREAGRLTNCWTEPWEPKTQIINPITKEIYLQNSIGFSILVLEFKQEMIIRGLKYIKNLTLIQRNSHN